MNPLRLLLALLFCLPLAACPGRGGGGGDDDDSAADDDDATADDDDATPVEFAIWSDDFVAPYFDNPHDCDQALPVEFSCGHSNPEISWEGAPDGTVAFALIFDDPTFGTPYAHWAIWDIPGDLTGLDAGISGYSVNSNLPSGAMELTNGSGFPGYLGSCPGPSSVNLYSWRLYALSDTLGGDFGSFGQLESAAQAASLDMVSMCHAFDGANSDI